MIEKQTQLEYEPLNPIFGKVMRILLYCDTAPTGRHPKKTIF